MILGIDPGKTGAMVLMNNEGEIIFKKIFDKLSFFQVSDAIKDIKDQYGYEEIRVYKESFASYGIDGRVSFVVGYQHGIIDTACRDAQLNVIDVTPQAWVKYIYNGEKSDLKPKERNKKKAIELFGLQMMKASKSRKVPHLGIVDAALIAEFGRRIS